MVIGRLLPNYLKITANLAGLDNLQPHGRLDDPDHPYFIKLQCENCGEITPCFSCVMISEEVPLPRVYGRGTVNSVQKCKLCDRVGIVKMISGFGKPLSHTSAVRGSYVRIMVFECQGFAPVEFSFGAVWKAQSGVQSSEFVRIRWQSKENVSDSRDKFGQILLLCNGVDR
ncbi:hypothetical protein LUZ62_040370 [Rhynchospora pubera]|uniref:Uncharacterized protein n=1 Tax=Rhynchospora pubera TaxID=906938 RepID=A0AAV8F7P5_9POAL|nr:hypothetical protein LUZ62_040370 [Rhynchospora pubera]